MECFHDQGTAGESTRPNKTGLQLSHSGAEGGAVFNHQILGILTPGHSWRSPFHGRSNLHGPPEQRLG